MSCSGFRQPQASSASLYWASAASYRRCCSAALPSFAATSASCKWTQAARANLEANPKVAAWFARTVCPDEALVQTLLVNSGRFQLCDDDLRYERFAGSRDGHPHLLTRADLPEILASGKHFARKFDLDHDERILDAIDERLA